MKRYIKANSTTEYPYEPIHITMYLHPIFYENSEILSAVTFDKKEHRYHTDVNPRRIINGPLSGPGEELQPPIADEWEAFVEDCKWLIREVGFTVISSNRSDTSEKSEYVIVYGIGNTPCGSIVFDLRISDHTFDATFPEEVKDMALEKLKIDNVLSGDATKAGIDFSVEGVLVGAVKNDSWDAAFNRLFLKLRHMKSKIQTRLKQREK